jgi:glycosyltransferase involved in cell wall biosynthesis
MSFDVIVCSNFSSPTGMRAVRYLRRKKIKYFIESDGGFAGTGKGIKEKIKRYFIKGASGYFSTAKEHDKYYLTYGAQEDKLFRYPFTSLFEKDIVDSVPSAEKKEELRAQLGVSNKRVVLTVGQFIHRKGFDLLLRSASRLKDFDFYFVGGVATQEYTELKSQLNLDNVYFVGFTNKEQLKKYYQCADLFALPTREDIWGLVVNEAMANGLPVVSTQRCVSATELVKDDVNGYVIPTNDVDALTNAISTILSDEQKIIEMSKNSLDIIHNYTFEQMAKVHIQIFSLIRETEYDKAKTND